MYTIHKIKSTSCYFIGHNTKSHITNKHIETTLDDLRGTLGANISVALPVTKLDGSMTTLIYNADNQRQAGNKTPFDPEDLARSAIQLSLDDYDPKIYQTNEHSQIGLDEFKSGYKKVLSSSGRVNRSSLDDLIEDIKGAVREDFISHDEDPHDDIATDIILKGKLKDTLESLEAFALAIKNDFPDASKELTEIVEDDAFRIVSSELFLNDSTDFDDKLRAELNDYSEESLAKIGITPDKELSDELEP